MAMGGFTGSGYRSSTELFSLDPANHPVPGCLAFRRSFPLEFSNAQATTLPSGEVLVCGGYSPTVGFMDRCYLYDPTANTWTRTAAPMSSPRQQAGSSYHPTLGFVMTGGFVRSGSLPSATTDATANGGASFRSDFAPMPRALYAHCQVTLDDDNIVIGGGRPTQSSSSNVFYRLTLRWGGAKFYSSNVGS